MNAYPRVRARLISDRAIYVRLFSASHTSSPLVIRAEGATEQARRFRDKALAKSSPDQVLYEVEFATEDRMSDAVLQLTRSVSLGFLAPLFSEVADPAISRAISEPLCRDSLAHLISFVHALTDFGINFNGSLFIPLLSDRSPAEFKVAVRGLFEMRRTFPMSNYGRGYAAGGNRDRNIIRAIVAAIQFLPEEQRLPILGYAIDLLRSGPSESNSELVSSHRYDAIVFAAEYIELIFERKPELRRKMRTHASWLAFFTYFGSEKRCLYYLGLVSRKLKIPRTTLIF